MVITCISVTIPDLQRRPSTSMTSILEHPTDARNRSRRQKTIENSFMASRYSIKKVEIILTRVAGGYRPGICAVCSDRGPGRDGPTPGPCNRTIEYRLRETEQSNRAFPSARSLEINY